MTGPAQPASNILQRARQRLLRLGLTDDHILPLAVPASTTFDVAQLEPVNADPHFEPVVQRVLRFLRGGRGLSVAVADDGHTGSARVHTAVQLAAGLSRQGIQVVVADMDFRNPGLQGLLADEHTEGIIDMVRFGRSCRSVLQTPVESGPALLAAGSFPVQDALPLQEDAVRSILHRVSLHCELALYVTPLLPDDTTLNPVVRLCEHVVLVQSLSEHSVDIVERIQLMQQARLHVAGVVLFDETAMHEAPAVPTWQPGPFVDQPARPAAAPEPPAAPAPPLPAFPVPPAAVPPPQSPTPAGPEVEPPAAPPHTPAPSSEPQGAAEPLPEPTAPTAMPHIPWSGRRNEEEQVAAPDSPAADEIPEIHLPEESSKRGPASGTPTVPAAPPEPAAASELRWDRPQKEAAPEEPPAQRPEPDAGEDRGWSIADADDAADADVRLATPADARRDSYEATDLEDAETEFAYDDGSNWSKMPLYILITLLVVIGGGFGWALWTKRGIERQVDEQMSDTDWIGEPQGTEPSAVPDDAAAMPGEDAQLPSSGLDALEGSESGGATAPSPPTGEGSSQPRTGEQQQASEPPAQTPRGSVTGGAAAAAGEAAGSGSEPTQPPPSTPSASPQRASSAATEFTYTVHVGSFRHLEQAYQDIATLQKHGFVGRAVKTDLGDKGIWYRVYVGGFATRSEAEQVRDSILELPEYRYAQVKRIPR